MTNKWDDDQGRAIAKALHDMGVKAIILKFSGSGDDGEIDTVKCEFFREGLSAEEVQENLSKIQFSKHLDLMDILQDTGGCRVGEEGDYCTGAGGCGGVTYMVNPDWLEETKVWVNINEELEYGDQEEDEEGDDDEEDDDAPETSDADHEDTFLEDHSLTLSEDELEDDIFLDGSFLDGAPLTLDEDAPDQKDGEGQAEPRRMKR